MFGIRYHGVKGAMGRIVRTRTGLPMYLPENDAQMFDILAELRLYASMNALHKLAEELDDAMLLLETEGRRQGRQRTEGGRAAKDRL